MTTPSQPFNRISRRYHFVNKIISLGLDTFWRSSAVKAAEIRHGMTVLDLGCGSGEMLELISCEVKKIGLDPELAMLKEGSARFLQIQGVGEKLPVRSESINRIISAFVLRNLSDRASAFLELHRALAQQGRGALIDFSPPQTKSLWNPINFYLKFILPVAGGILAYDFDAYRYLSRTVLKFPQPDRIEEELAQAGFSVIRSRRLIGGVAVLYTFQKLDG